MEAVVNYRQGLQGSLIYKVQSCSKEKLFRKIEELRTNTRA